MRNSILLIYFIFLLVNACRPTVKEVRAPEYTGSESCRSCHSQAYEQWRASDHYLAMQRATDSTVLGDFNNIVFKGDGVTTTFFKKDGTYYINTEGPDGLHHDYEVQYTFGHNPLQQYLIAFPGGRMQSARVSWDAREHKWFNQYAGQQIDHRDWLHWTGNSQNWNTMCASCHSTDLRKNYDFKSDSYQTTWKEINVSCESCHGPGSAHIAYIQSQEYADGKRIRNAGLNYGRDTLSVLQLNTCASCHARKSDISPDRTPEGHLMDDMIPQIISQDVYYADGQIKDEDYEYGSFAQSKMFHRNVRCSSCHNPHTGKTRLTGNQLCLSCHKPSYGTEAHHHHQMDTEGSLCINCHMATRTYMGVDHRRDHSFRIPRPDQSVTYGTPNACTRCHQDRSDPWAAKAVETWYGPERAYHFSDDLLPGSLLNKESEPHLIRLLADGTQPEIARATAAYYLGNIQTITSAEALIHASSDSCSLVRYHVVRALENFPVDIWRQKVYPVLTDSIRAVRIAAAGLYKPVGMDLLPQDQRESLSKADAEQYAFLQYQTDFAVGNVMMGDYKLQRGDYAGAIDYFQRGLRKDSLMNYARLHMATAYNASGQNAKAIEVLKEASVVDPFNDDIFFNLGLLEAEIGEGKEAITYFQKAEQLGSRDSRLYYNYGLMLFQQGDEGQAEQIWLKGYKASPESEELNYVLAFYFVKRNQNERAMPFGRKLYALNPGGAEYQDLFHALGFR